VFDRFMSVVRAAVEGVVGRGPRGTRDRMGAADLGRASGPGCVRSCRRMRRCVPGPAPLGSRVLVRAHRRRARPGRVARGRYDVFAGGLLVPFDDE